MRQWSLAHNGWVILVTTYYYSRHSSRFHVMCATGAHAQIARVISSMYNPLQHHTEQWFWIWHDSGRSRPSGMPHKIQEPFARHVFLVPFLACLLCGPLSDTGYNACFIFLLFPVSLCLGLINRMNPSVMTSLSTHLLVNVRYSPIPIVNSGSVITILDCDPNPKVLPSNVGTIHIVPYFAF